MLFEYGTAEWIVMPTMLVLIVFAGFLMRYLFRNKSDKIRNIPLTIIAVVLIALEIAKQIYLIATDTWTTWAIPMHFCSWFLIWFALAQFTRGKFNQLARGCSIASCIVMTVSFYASPKNIVGEACSNYFNNFTSFHTLTFHMLVVAYGIWSIILNVYRAEKRHIWQAVALFAAEFLLIIASAYIFDTNFTNVLTSSIPLLEQFRLTCGQVPYLLVMFTFGVLLLPGIVAIIYAIQRRFVEVDDRIVVAEELRP